MRMPPLNALRAFEAAARLGSFAAAAQELNVSPGAISRHVKLLEADLGRPLFSRQAQGVRITAAGTRLSRHLTLAFATITEATEAVRNLPASLRLIASPTFANRLLIPRLSSFTAAHPEIDVSVGVLISDTATLSQETHDCAVITIHPDDVPPGWHATRICGEKLIPFCAPSLLKGHAPPYPLSILNQLPLLDIVHCPNDWPRWFAANGVGSPPEAKGSASLTTGEMAIRAAVEGLGVIIIDRNLVLNELQDQSLIDMFPASTPVDDGYHFLCEAPRHNEPVIAGFREWVISTFRRPG